MGPAPVHMRMLTVVVTGLWVAFGTLIDSSAPNFHQNWS